MNCPRCTHDISDDSSFCPRCGLDLSAVSLEPETAAAESPLAQEPLMDQNAAFEEEPAVGTESGGFWPQTLRIHSTRNPKRPYRAATLAFFFGPFTYLYLEQANWFWWGLLGGLFLILVSRAEAIPILLIGYMLHAFDVARLLNEEQAATAPAESASDGL